MYWEDMWFVLVFVGKNIANCSFVPLCLVYSSDKRCTAEWCRRKVEWKEKLELWHFGTIFMLNTLASNKAFARTLPRPCQWGLWEHRIPCTHSCDPCTRTQGKFFGVSEEEVACFIASVCCTRRVYLRMEFRLVFWMASGCYALAATCRNPYAHSRCWWLFSYIQEVVMYSKIGRRRTSQPDLRTSVFCETLAHYVLHCARTQPEDKNV